MSFRCLPSAAFRSHYNNDTYILSPLIIDRLDDGMTMENSAQDANAMAEGIEDPPLHLRHVSREREDSETSEKDDFGRQSPLLSNQVRDVNDQPQRRKAHGSFGDGGDTNSKPIKE
jgi:hypothetical protein